MTTISFMTANYVARPLNYRMTEGWAQGDSATNDYFRPVETYAERLETVFRDIQALGFTAIDLWAAHLNPAWATTEHIAIARDLLQQYPFQIVSFAAWMTDVSYLEATCRLVTALGITLIGGGGPLINEDYTEMVRVLRQYDIQYGYENHPEVNAEAILARIGDQDTDIIGVAYDTGWMGTQGEDAAATARLLLPRIKHVHLKDVTQVGQHITCRYGQGIVDLQGTVAALQAAGYSGAYSVEHEPETHDPTDDIVASTLMLKQWLGMA